MRRRILENKIQYESVTATSNIATTITINGSSKSNTKSYTVQVPYGTTYTVSASNITNYSKTGGGTYTASLPTRSVSITYSLLLEQVTVTSDKTVYITINGSSGYGTSRTVNVPYGTTYTVSIVNYYYDYYTTPASLTFTAGQSTRNITMNLIPSRIRIHVTINYNGYWKGYGTSHLSICSEDNIYVGNGRSFTIIDYGNYLGDGGEYPTSISGYVDIGDYVRQGYDYFDSYFGGLRVLLQRSGNYSRGFIDSVSLTPSGSIEYGDKSGKYEDAECYKGTKIQNCDYYIVVNGSD